jgi:microcystin-dependent protein
MDPFIGEVRMFTGTYVPEGWACCDGQLMQISEDTTALFSIIGTAYGGDGIRTFALPNLQAMAPLGAGQGPGLTLRRKGDQGGASTITLTDSQMPSHKHSVNCSVNPGAPSQMQGGVWATAAGAGQTAYASTPGPTPAQFSSQALQPTGGGGPHNNMPPYLTVMFIICVSGGLYPQRQ